MTKKNLLWIIPAVLLIILLKSCTSSRTPSVDNSTNEQLLKRVGELEDENKELKTELAKIKGENTKLQNDNNKLRLSQNVETESIEKPPLKTKTDETKPETKVDKKMADDLIWQFKLDFENDADIETEMDSETLLVHMYPKNDFAKSLRDLMVNTTDTRYIDSWNNITMGLVYTSYQFHDKTKQDVKFIIHDPDNKERILFSTHNDYEHENFLEN